jgi:hypothetical protein
MEFKNFEDAREAYRLANKTKIRGKQISARPLMHSEDTWRPDSLSEFDPMIFNRNILVLKNLPKDTTIEELQKQFPKAIITLVDDGKYVTRKIN